MELQSTNDGVHPGPIPRGSTPIRSKAELLREIDELALRKGAGVDDLRQRLIGSNPTVWPDSGFPRRSIESKRGVAQ